MSISRYPSHRVRTNYDRKRPGLRGPSDTCPDDLGSHAPHLMRVLAFAVTAILLSCTPTLAFEFVPTHSLVGRVGSPELTDFSSGFFVGSTFSRMHPINGGRLYLGYNDGFVRPDRGDLDSGGVNDNSGSFSVVITRNALVSTTFTVSSTAAWQDTGVDIFAGDLLEISAKKKQRIQFDSSGSTSGPDGLPELALVSHPGGTCTFLLCSPDVTPIYENASAWVFQLPSERVWTIADENVADLLIGTLIDLGFFLIDGKAALAFKFIGYVDLFLKTVGVETEVRVEVLAHNEFVSWVGVNENVSPIIIYSPGDCFNTGVTLTINEAKGAAAPTTIELLTSAEIEPIGDPNLGPFLVLPKQTIQLGVAGRYKFAATAWCTSEGTDSVSLRVR